MFLLTLNGGGSLGNRNRKTGWKIDRRIEVAAVSREASDCDELSGLAGERFGDDAYASVRGDHDIEGASRDGVIKGLAKMRIGMNVFDIGPNLGNFVSPTM